MAIDISNITETSATLYYIGTSIDNVNKKDIDWYLDNRYVGSSIIPPGNIGSNGCWISGLSPNTYYDIRANITWYGEGSGTKVEYSSFKTLSIRPNNFSWSSSARNAFTSKGVTISVNHTEWNSFVQRVKEFYDWYWNGTVDLSGLERSKIDYTDKVLYAWKFNTVRSAVGSMASTGLGDFSPGDNVVGNYFILLESRMNSVSTPRNVLEDNYVKPTDEEAYFLYYKCFNELEEIGNGDRC